MSVRYLDAAVADAGDAANYYDSKSIGLGDEFLLELQECIGTAEDRPERYPSDSRGRRRCNLKRFPYHFLYEIHEEFIRLIVIRHNNRNPDYGTSRR